MASIEPRTFHDTSQPYYMPNDAPEWERLDDMHKGIDIYLGHKLSLGPAVHNVKNILEIGCGTGTWAIQAAQTYPEAVVTAIDISPLPSRPLPSNVQFLQLDVTEPLPFEPANFDIIHARLVFVHVPHWKQILENIATLLRSRGWLWIEDVDIYFYDDGPQGLGSHLQVFNDVYLSFSRSKNIDQFVGSSLDSVLRKLEIFSEVNGLGIKCPLNGKDEDPIIQSIGRVFSQSTYRALKSSNAKLIAAGLTSELLDEVIREAQDPSRGTYYHLRMMWSQKK